MPDRPARRAGEATGEPNVAGCSGRRGRATRRPAAADSAAMRISAKADYAVRAAVALAAAGGERPTKGDTIARGLVGFGHNSESALRQWTKWDIDAASGPRDRRRRPPR